MGAQMQRPGADGQQMALWHVVLLASLPVYIWKNPKDEESCKDEREGAGGTVCLAALQARGMHALPPTSPQRHWLRSDRRAAAAFAERAEQQVQITVGVARRR